MKRILITGKNSYIGNSFKKWVSKWPDKYRTYSISVRGDEWRKHDFSQYDVLLHCAGIAHVSAKPKMAKEYYRVNRDLAIDIAKKAKKENVRQFIFMSSIIVYGESGKINEKKVIDIDTQPEPSNFYGDSKLQAEKGIKLLETDDFKIAILRPPMIYGKDSKGNYQKLSKLAKVTPIFPDIDNQRSMLHIDNLCEFLRLIIDNEDRGVFFPQNDEYVKTSEMVRLIANVNGKKIKLIKNMDFLFRFLSGRINIINKVFGNLVYEKGMSLYKENYIVRNFKESIEISEK